MSTGRPLAALAAILLLGLTDPGLPMQPEPARTMLTLADGAIAELPAVRGTTPRLVVLLHGAGEDPGTIIDHVAADCGDAVLLAPKAAGATWDIIAAARRRAMAATSLTGDVLRYRSSPDADRVFAAMAALGRHVEIDPSRTLLLGFSDGATFAVALGSALDRPFAGVIAVAPGLVALPARAAGRRPLLVLHGTGDRTLPFDVTRATIVPALRQAGLAVAFVAFDGGHALPPHPCSTYAQRFGR